MSGPLHGCTSLRSNTKGRSVPGSTLSKSGWSGLITTLRSSGFTKLGAMIAKGGLCVSGNKVPTFQDLLLAISEYSCEYS